MYQLFPQENRIIADKTTLSADLKLQLMRTHPGTFLYSISVRITWLMLGAISDYRHPLSWEINNALFCYILHLW